MGCYSETKRDIGMGHKRLNGVDKPARLSFSCSLAFLLISIKQIYTEISETSIGCLKWWLCIGDQTPFFAKSGCRAVLTLFGRQTSSKKSISPKIFEVELAHVISVENFGRHAFLTAQFSFYFFGNEGQLRAPVTRP